MGVDQNLTYLEPIFFFNIFHNLSYQKQIQSLASQEVFSKLSLIKLITTYINLPKVT